MRRFGPWMGAKIKAPYGAEVRNVQRAFAFLIGILAVAAGYRLGGWLYAFSTVICFVIGFLRGREDRQYREKSMFGSGYVSGESAKDRNDGKSNVTLGKMHGPE